MIFKNGKLRTKIASIILTSLLASTASLSAVQQAAAVSGFMGDYDPANWTLTNSNANGFVNTSGAPGTIVLVGGDNRSFSAGDTDFTIAVPCGGTITFDWTYQSFDRDGPFFDPAGYLVNGGFVQLSNNDGPTVQGGTTVVVVSDGDTFGFRVHTLDNIFGAGAFTRITNFQATDCNAPPVCENASPSVAILWPPNHKLVDISIGGITDPDNDPITTVVHQVTQDEPTNGLGDGDQTPDASGVGTDTAQLRAERSGNGDGRVYNILFSADDGKGGICRSSVSVGVPHDVKDTPIDSGQTVDSTS